MLKSLDEAGDIKLENKAREIGSERRDDGIEETRGARRCGAEQQPLEEILPREIEAYDPRQTLVHP